MNSSLSSQISDLLYDYDCVIVPALGGFVTNYRAASLDKGLHLFQPPGKDLSFNSKLLRNDGILADAIAKRDSLSHEEANGRIKKEVESYFSALNAGERVVFDKVGIIYFDKEKNLQFSPDESTNYLLESYGLKRVYARPVEPIEAPAVVPVEPKPAAPAVAAILANKKELKKDKPAAVAAKTAAKKVEETPVVAITTEGRHEAEQPLEQEKKSRKVYYWAAALVPLFLYMGVVTYNSGVMTDGSMQLSDLNPFRDTITSRYSERDEVMNLDIPTMPDYSLDKSAAVNEEPLREETSGSTKLSAKKPEPLVTPEAKVSLTKPEPVKPISTYVAPSQLSHLEFHVIAGCYSVERNAQKMVDRLRKNGFNAFILDKRKGLHRVTYASFARRDEATTFLNDVKKNNDQAAWLLRKK